MNLFDQDTDASENSLPLYLKTRNGVRVSLETWLARRKKEFNIELLLQKL